MAQQGENVEEWLSCEDTDLTQHQAFDVPCLAGLLVAVNYHGA